MLWGMQMNDRRGLRNNRSPGFFALGVPRIERDGLHTDLVAVQYSVLAS